MTTDDSDLTKHDILTEDVPTQLHVNTARLTYTSANARLWVTSVTGDETYYNLDTDNTARLWSFVGAPFDFAQYLQQTLPDVLDHVVNEILDHLHCDVVLTVDDRDVRGLAMA